MNELAKSCIAAAVAGVLAAPVSADGIACADPRFSTLNAGADAERICDAAVAAAEELATCNLTVPSPLLIEVSGDVGENCLGLYHCGEARVEILSVASYEELIASDRVGAFAPVSPDAFFDSIVRHELTHAALGEMPCPLASCRVGQEYVAYTMQVRFLPDADRAAFEAVDRVDGQVSRDILNQIILLMAPEVFARRAWQHLTQRPDPCGFIGQIARGEVLLDRPMR